MKLQIVTLAILFSIFAAPSFSVEPVTGRLSLGYVDTSGNTDEQKLNFDFDLKQKRSEKFKTEYKGLFNYGKANGTTNTDKKSISLFGEMVQDERRSFYGNLGLLQDEFAGYENQRIVGLGYLWNLIKSEDMNLRILAGSEFTHDEYTDNTSKDVGWYKIGFKGDRKMAENIKLISQLDVVSPKVSFSSDYQADFMLGGVFTVNTQFDLETKYSLSYISNPVVAGKKKSDSIFYTNLVYKL